MSLYTSIGQIPNDLYPNTFRQTGTGAWGTAQAFQFKDNIRLDGLHFEYNDGSTDAVSFLKLWSTATGTATDQDGYGLLYASTAANRVYMPLGVPLSTNEALVIFATATNYKRCALEYSRWSIERESVSMIPIVDGVPQSGGGGASTLSGTSTSLVLPLYSTSTMITATAADMAAPSALSDGIEVSPQHVTGSLDFWMDGTDVSSNFDLIIHMLGRSGTWMPIATYADLQAEPQANLRRAIPDIYLYGTRIYVQATAYAAAGTAHGVYVGRSV